LILCASATLSLGGFFSESNDKRMGNDKWKMIPTLQADFDRIALVSPDGATHNEHYHEFLLRHLPAHCQRALDIGCGTGTFARRLAERSQHVTAIDLSPEMIRLAQERSAKFTNIDFQLADINEVPLSPESFDCIASIATLHHLPFAEILLQMRTALKPRGTILILDLFEPEGWLDSLSNLAAILVSVGLRLRHQGRLLPRRVERAAWAAHERHDRYPTIEEVRGLCARIIPGAEVKKHLLWRYSIVWNKNTHLLESPSRFGPTTGQFITKSLPQGRQGPISSSFVKNYSSHPTTRIAKALRAAK
jgi:ubiquinone/menaquinone biosynthesis C-methylase UbiE